MRNTLAVIPNAKIETMAKKLLQIEHFFETFAPADVERLDQWYAPEASFKDPFNHVQGVAAIQSIFRHMFTVLNEPRFVIKGRVLQDQQCFLVWDFIFRFQRFDTQTTQTIHGTSHLILNAQGLIMLHRDYWDAAEELYEKIPVLQCLMRWLKRQARG